jgi:hypothetical protein
MYINSASAFPTLAEFHGIGNIILYKPALLVNNIKLSSEAASFVDIGNEVAFYVSELELQYFFVGHKSTDKKNSKKYMYICNEDFCALRQIDNHNVTSSNDSTDPIFCEPRMIFGRNKSLKIQLKMTV